MRRPVLLLLLSILLGQTTPASALVLAWNPSPTATGYRLWYGTNSGMYQEVLDAKSATQVSVGGLHEGYLYFFAATAYNPYGESGYSQEVSAVIPSAPVVTLTSPVDGATVPRRAVVPIEAEVTSSAPVVLVTFLVNASERCAVPSAPYACDWPVPAANRRSYQLQARAVDTSGRVGISPIIVVTAQ